MATSTEPKLKVPGESTTNPSFAAPQIQTAPDVRQSQAVAGNIPSPVNASPTVTSQPSQSPAKSPSTSSSSTPGASPTTSSVIPPTPNATATVPTATGAPPGVPQTTPPPTVGLPPTPKALQGKNAAENDFIQAQNEAAQKQYEAALAYNGGPTGALALDQQRAEAGLRGATANRGAAHTIESSLFGQDKNLISTQRATADTQAYIKYQTSITEANEFLNKAQIAYARATEQEKREIAEAAERREQTEAIVNASKSSPSGYPIPPAQQSAIAAGTPAGPGGVVPYESKKVRVGMPPKPQRKGY